MLHVDEQSARFGLLHFDKFARGVDRRDSDAALLAFIVEFFFGALRAELGYAFGYNVRMLAAVGHLLELRTGNLRRTSHPLDQAAPLFDRDDKNARIAVLRRIGIVEIGLFAFGRGARWVLTRV